MVDPKATLVRAWMAKARSDLGTAKKLAGGPDAYLDTAIYHCQQAAEKAIKALLVQHDLRFEKTHDLEVLIARAIPAAPTLKMRHEGNGGWKTSNGSGVHYPES